MSQCRVGSFHMKHYSYELRTNTFYVYGNYYHSCSKTSGHACLIIMLKTNQGELYPGLNQKLLCFVFCLKIILKNNNLYSKLSKELANGIKIKVAETILELLIKRFLTVVICLAY